MKEAELQITEKDVAIVPTKPNLMALIERATFDPNFDPAKLQVLMEMSLKWEANEARKAFVDAMQRFKANPPDINKTKHVSFPTSGGGRTDYYHAELDKITDIIGDSLKQVGIVHSWRTSDSNGKVTVTCVLTHELGHSEDAATLSGPSDTSGGKNNIQAIGSTVTYLQRYTLLAATGLAAKGTDDDGKTEGMSQDGILDYCAALKDATTLPELQRICKEAVEKANHLNDSQAKEQFRKVYEERKRSLRETAQ